MARHYRCPNDGLYLYKAVRDSGFGDLAEIFVCRVCNYSIPVDDAKKELKLIDDNTFVASSAPAASAPPVRPVSPASEGEVELP
jgi:hypothetical protein